MKENNTPKLTANFGRFFWIWMSLNAILIVVLLTQYYFNIQLRKNPIDSWPSICYFIMVLFGLALSGIAYVWKFEFDGRPNLTTVRIRMKLIIMAVVLLSLLTCNLTSYSLLPSEEPPTLIQSATTCNEVLKDSSLYPCRETNDSGKYVIKTKDSIRITGLNCQQYSKLKEETRRALLASCDIELKRKGYYPSGSRIISYLGPGDTNQVVISELIDEYFFRITEKTFAVDSNYYYKAKVCVAKDNSIDSLINSALTKHCMRWAAQNKVAVPLQNAISITIYLPEIIQTVCDRCPQDKFVKEIQRICGGDYDCDSIYFTSGGYELSYISKLALECFFNELQRTKQKYTIDFYGYTDPRRVIRNKKYTGSGAMTRLNKFLPNENEEFTPIDSITNNDQLSFARAYSCYDFMKSKLTESNMKFRYTGCGESNNGIDDIHQRVVKITITKL